MELPNHNSLVILHHHNNVTTQFPDHGQDITVVIERSKVFRESARHNIFGLHSKATLKFLVETLTGKK